MNLLAKKSTIVMIAPYYRRMNDGNCTLPTCEHPKFGTGGYDNVIPDIDNGWHRNEIPKISKRCPHIVNPQLQYRWDRDEMGN